MRMAPLAALTLVLAAPALADSLLPPARYANVQLPDPRQERQAKALMETIRCLVCQGQSIADSNAEMAGDMRCFGPRADPGGRKPGGDPRLAGRALRRLGELHAAGRAGDLAALGGAAAAPRLAGCSSRAAASGGGGGPDGLDADAASRSSGVAVLALRRLDKGALQFLGAALLLAVAGYAWQGQPGLAGSPKRAVEQKAVPDKRLRVDAPRLLGRFDTAGTWLTMADGYAARRRHRGRGGIAAECRSTAIRATPTSGSPMAMPWSSMAAT
jgi:hypothetical protein